MGLSTAAVMPGNRRQSHAKKAESYLARPRVMKGGWWSSNKRRVVVKLILPGLVCPAAPPRARAVCGVGAVKLATPNCKKKNAPFAQVVVFPRLDYYDE